MRKWETIFESDDSDAGEFFGFKPSLSEIFNSSDCEEKFFGFGPGQIFDSTDNEDEIHSFEPSLSELFEDTDSEDEFYGFWIISIQDFFK